MKRLALFLLALSIAGSPVDGLAQSGPPDLREMTLEELLGVEVTSAGRRQQRAEDVAAAIYVITREDIRRSGLTILPEVLRLAPGVQVAQVNANKWAVSVRGFNALYSNKLLILVDGRSVYNRSFSGVFWDGQDLDVEEIERIEVVRGPGGAMWGSNAVNGIINIITRSAHESKGGSAGVAVGTFEDGRAALRYGGGLGRASYRLYGQWSGYGEGLTAGGTPNGDQWRSLSTGYRLDWANATDTVMAQGHYTAGRGQPKFVTMESFAPDVFSTSGVTDTDEVSALGRWTRTAGDGSVLQVQAYTTNTRRDEAILYSVERSADLDFQYEKPLNRHVLVIGGGYRYVDLATRNIEIGPEQGHLVSFFAQDEFAVTRQVRLAVGARMERESFSGWGLSPSARVMWNASSRHRIWAALSRARRTPSAIDRTLRFNLESMPANGLPVLVAATGNPEYETELLTQAEAGYRVRIGSRASVDLTVFRGYYDGLTTYEPQAPVFEATPFPAHVLVALQVANLMDATTTGAEVAATWSPLDAWRLDASYAGVRTTPSVAALSHDEGALLFDGNAPRHQGQVRSTTRIGPRVHAHAALHRVGALRSLAIPAYTRLDANVEITLGGGLTAMLAGRNLTGSHEEFPGPISGVVASSVPRNAHVQLRWRF